MTNPGPTAPRTGRIPTPESSQVGGLKARPVEYERRVTRFFDRSLLE